MPTTEKSANGTYLKYQDPNVWVFISRDIRVGAHSALRAFQGPRENPGGQGGGLAITCDIAQCTCTAEVWVWDYLCDGADDDTLIIMPTDQPLDTNGDPVDGRWVKLTTALV